jgi:hypothetical protein
MSDPIVSPADVVARHRKARDKRAEWEGLWRFSCWNADDPNRAKIERADEKDREFAVCLRIARRAVAGALADPTRGATHYHAADANPPWAAGRQPSAVIGRHKFYNDVE